MADMLANTGAVDILNAFFNNVFPTSKNLTLRLFTNNHSPASADTAASYTEAAGGGYAAITLTNGSWVQSLTNSIEQVAYAQQTFGFTGALTTNPIVYGYYITDGSASPALVAAGLLLAPFTPANNGDQIQVTPVIQLSHGTPAA